LDPIEQRDFDKLFKSYDDKELPLQDLAVNLRGNLLKILASEDVTGEQRSMIRELYVTIDKVVEEYSSVTKLLGAGRESTDKQKLAQANLEKVVNMCRNSLTDFFKRQIKISTPQTGDSTPINELNSESENFKQIQDQLAENPDDDRAYNSLGNYYFTNKEYSKSIEQYEKAISKNPQNYIYYSNIGDAYFQLEDYPRSKEYYEKALEKRPTDDVTLNSLANVHATLEEYEDAIKNYKKALETNVSPVYFQNIGNVYVRMQQYDNAIEAFENAKFVGKNYNLAYDSLGDVYKLKYEEKADESLLNKAIECYQESLRIDSENAKTYSLLADCFYLLGKFDEAITNYEESIRINPNDANTVANLGYTYFWKGDYDKPITYYNRALDIDENFVTVRKYIAEYNKALNKYPEAIENYMIYLESYPNRSDALMGLSEIYLKYSEADPSKGDYVKALEFSQRAVNADPKNYDVYVSLAYAYKGLGQIDQAISTLEKAIHENDKDPSMYSSLGSLYVDKPNFTEAIKNFEKAIGLNQNDPENYAWLGSIYMKVKDWNKSEQYAKTADKIAKKINPDDNTYLDLIALIHHNRGLDYYNNGELESAIKEYNVANEMKESDVTYYNLYLCYFWWKPRRTEEAKAAILKAIQLSPRKNPNYTSALDQFE
jgi:tetratricopeptide (TPR) repeat protein